MRSHEFIEACITTIEEVIHGMECSAYRRRNVQYDGDVILHCALMISEVVNCCLVAEGTS